jgi:hypothetical protein
LSGTVVGSGSGRSAICPSGVAILLLPHAGVFRLPRVLVRQKSPKPELEITGCDVFTKTEQITVFRARLDKQVYA